MAGDVLQEEHNSVAGIYLIETGYVTLRVFSPITAKLVLIDLLGPGDLLNTADIFGEENLSARIQALRAGRSYFIKKHILKELLQSQLSFCYELLTWQASSLHALRQRLVQFVYSDSETRLLNVLQTILERFGHAEDKGMRLALSLKRKELAELAGVTPETATRILGQLRRRGLLSLDSDGIFLSKSAARY
jgi:CRP/FNR family transcriptional regulator